MKTIKLILETIGFIIVVLILASVAGLSIGIGAANAFPKNNGLDWLYLIIMMSGVINIGMIIVSSIWAEKILYKWGARRVKRNLKKGIYKFK